MVDSLKDEVKKIPAVIRENIHFEKDRKEDALLITFNELQTKETISKAIQTLFSSFPFVNILVEAVNGMVALMDGGEGGSVKEILRWQERSFKRRLGNKVIGMEYHYKVKILDETKGWVGMRKKKTILMIGYKAVIYMMTLDPNDFPDEDEMKKIGAA